MDGRRSFLVVAGSAILSGCVGLRDGGSDDGGTGPDDGSNGPDDAGGSTTDGGTDPTPTATSTPTTAGETAGPADTTTEPTTTPTTATPMATPSGTPERIVKRTTRVKEKDWSQYYWQQSTEATLVYEFTVTEGPAIDAMVLAENEFRLYRQGQRAEYIGRASAVGSTGDRVRVTLPAPEERYVLLFDNTYFGPTGPPRNAVEDTAVIEVDATVYHP